jgi:hypothetical protein
MSVALTPSGTRGHPEAGKEQDMRLTSMKNIALTGLLGGALLLGSPLQGNAEPGKGRGHGNGKGVRSERGEKRVERRVERGVRGNGNGRVFRSQERGSVKRSGGRRSEERVVRRADDYTYRAPSRTKLQTSYRAPRWSGGRYYTGSRYYTAYRGYPVYREYVSYRYAPAYAPCYGWRYYCAPRYDYGTHVIYVNPVRFFVAADFVIGGVGISARYVDPGPVYGCNFCDARFEAFYDYEAHVEHHCAHAPHGYNVIADNWQDHVWEDGQDDGYYEDDGYDDE